MFTNMLTKKCKVFDILPKNQGGFIAPVDGFDENSFIELKCAVYTNNTNQSNFPEQEFQQTDLNLLILSHENLQIKQIVEFEDCLYKILNIKKEIKYANYVKNQGVKLELIKYEQFL